MSRVSSFSQTAPPTAPRAARLRAGDMGGALLCEVIAMDEQQEEWRPVEGYPYEVSNLGDVRRAVSTSWARAGRKLSPHIAGPGYPMVTLWGLNGEAKRYVCVHVLIAEAFLPTSQEDSEVHHLDGNKLNNRADNLVWATRTQHRGGYHHGINVGEKHGMSKLTEDDVRQVLRLRAEGLTQQRIASAFGVNQSVVSEIVNKKSWAHIQ